MQETTELTTQDTFDKVVLIQPCPTFLHLVHEGSNLLLIHLNTFYIVYHMIELLAAYLARLGQRSFLELFLNHLLHLTDTTLLAQVDNTDTGSFLAGTTRTTATMGVILYIIGHTVVDDMRQVVHIQTSGCHISSHQQLGTMLAELLHGKVALLLREVAMQGISIITVTNQVICYLLRLHTGTTEDNGIDTRVEVHHSLQGQILILGMHHIIDVVYLLGTFITTAHLNLALLLQVVLGYSLYLLTHSSTEEQGSVSLGNTLKDSVQLFLESHGEHLISLIQYHILNLREVSSPAFHQINQTTRRSHNNIHTCLQGTDLRFYVGSAIHRQDGQVRQKLAKTLHIIGDLYTKFTCWAEDNCLGKSLILPFRNIHQFQDRQSVCGCLTRSCLGKGNQISTLLLVQQKGNHGLLNRHRMFISLFLNSL